MDPVTALAAAELKRHLWRILRRVLAVVMPVLNTMMESCNELWRAPVGPLVWKVASMDPGRSSWKTFVFVVPARTLAGCGPAALPSWSTSPLAVGVTV